MGRECSCDLEGVSLRRLMLPRRLRNDISFRVVADPGTERWKRVARTRGYATTAAGATSERALSRSLRSAKEIRQASAVEARFEAAELGDGLVAVHPLARDPVPVRARVQLPEQ